jgi:hypothetical protein
MLLDCVATFTCTELCTYKQFMFYTLLTSLIALDRTTLRKKVRRCFASVSATTFPFTLSSHYTMGCTGHLLLSVLSLVSYI